jgi:hypothetical protein
MDIGINNLNELLNGRGLPTPQGSNPLAPTSQIVKILKQLQPCALKSATLSSLACPMTISLCKLIVWKDDCLKVTCKRDFDFRHT